MPSIDSRGTPNKAAVASANLRKQAERSIQKERYKDAVKQAKMAFKEERTPENHRLLERAYFLRARQLLQLGMRESAVEVAQFLVDFGVTGADSLEELVQLLITLGFEKKALEIRERLDPPVVKERMAEPAAVQLVIPPEREAATSPKSARDANAVRPQSHPIMPSKDSLGTSKKASEASANLRKEVERSIAKERYKDAVKQAKMAYKEEGTPENHRLLENAYFLRARQLLQLGMRESAVEVVQHLLDFGVTGSDSLDELVHLLITLGFEKNAFQIQERLGSPEMKVRMAELAADQLVIRPPRTAAISPEQVRDAGLVRQSLEKLQAKDEAGAMELLRDLARSSPLSEWKFFVRGLAAFYRGDAAETQANWDRLDSKRMASAIAERLRRLVQEGTPADQPKLEAMETLIFGEPILDRLLQVRSLTAGQDWDKVIRLVGSLRQSLNRVDPKLAERLTFVVIGSLIKAATHMRWAEAKKLVTNFTRVAQPLAIDPRWNRLWAMLWDGPHAEPGGAIDHWLDYINDLATVESFKPAERALAQAIVWNHVALLRRIHVADLSATDEPNFSPFRGRGRPVVDEREVAAAKKGVIDALERSLKLAPEYRPTHWVLVEVYDDWDDAKNLEAAAKRLLAVFPEDGETLQLLGEHYIESNDLAAALPVVQKARRIKPLDESLRELEWTIRVGLSRNCALSQRWDEGRAEFAAAEELLPDCRREYSYLARRATFELKAGDVAKSDQYLRDAQEGLVEPAPLWLAMLIESIRYHTPQTTVDTYARLWEADLKKKYRGETAGALAELLGSFLSAGIEYRGRADHIKQVVAYLRRGVRSKYLREDIERVTEFLQELPEEVELLEKLVKAGVKQHPDSALLHMRAGSLELSKGTFMGGSTSARKHLETALKLAEASTNPKVTAYLNDIRGMLSLLNEVSERTRGFGAFFGGGPFSMPIPRPGRGKGQPMPGPALPFFEGMDFDDDFDNDDFDNDDFDNDGFVPPPTPTRRPGQKRASRKRP